MSNSPRILNPDKLIMYYHDTLIKREPIQLSKITTKTSYALRNSRHWTIPRTFDETDKNCHYAHLVEHLLPADRISQIAKWSKGIRHQVIPHHMADLLYKIMMSALPWYPSEKQNSKKTRKREGTRQNARTTNAATIPAKHNLKPSNTYSWNAPK